MAFFFEYSMRRLLLALLILPLCTLAAADMSAERQQSQFLIEQAYLKYPAIPAGFLESQAWVATRWQHRIPQTTEAHHGMPPVYGLFGLYGANSNGFVDLVGAVSSEAGLSRDELLASEAVYVDAVAAFVDNRIRENGLGGAAYESLRPVAELLSGIKPTSAATEYAVASHVYEMYRTAGTGLDLGVVTVKPRRVDLQNVFSAAELEQLQAETLVFDIEGESIDTAASKKKSASFAVGSNGSPEQVNVDYPGATWEEAYGFSSRSGSAITHVVVHTMQGSYAGSIAWFLNPASNVSAHYLMRSSDGQITQMVRHIDKAWHVRSANPYTIGIEHEGFVDNADWYTDTMYEESAKLSAYICAMHTIDCSMTYDGPSHDTVVVLTNDYTVKGHQHFADQTHTDPGINWDWPRYHALVNGGVTPPVVNFLPEANFTWVCTANSCDYDATTSADSDGSITAYDWDFGDDSVGTFATVSHTFANSGDYSVVLSTTDNAGAVHTTLRSVRATVAPVPAQPLSRNSGGGALGPWFLLVLVLVAGCSRGVEVRLDMPQLNDAEYYWVAARIFENETNSKLEYLTHWNEGEDFPSMGIGHFIWFPEGVDAPFDESFPAMLAYVREHADKCAPAPAWLSGPDVPAAPWASKTSFDAALDEPRLAELRDWLASTAPVQAQYIVASFSARWNALELEEGDEAALTAVLQRLLASSQGQFAVIDYFNFKGLGSNPRERYAGEGWGLVQALRDMAPAAADDGAALVAQFSKATADRLALRVQNAPPARNEGRWLEGWHRRVAAYTDSAPPLSSSPESAYRVTPYLQSVTATSANLTWFSERPGDVAVTAAGAGHTIEVAVEGPRRACELAYHLAEFDELAAARFVPYQYTAVLDGLAPGQSYTAEVVQDGETVVVEVRTPSQDGTHFVVYADSETEPESTGEFVQWTAPGEATGEPRRYLVDQTTGYRANLAAIAAKKPEFVAIAGDLVESGGEQRDWDEFWRHNASIAASIPIVPALGNHDYFGGPGDLGWFGAAATTRALAKYRSYFGRPPYYVVEQGPMALIIIDTNNGGPERSPSDTNWYLTGTAPDWQESSAQRQWLEEALAKAQRDKPFTFVMFHAAPYSSGVHNRTPGIGDGENFSSGHPLRELTPLFLRYGVDAVFNGHDEMYEHSALSGLEHNPDGSKAAHTVHYFVVGIGGDGLRGPDALVSNPQRVFLAHEDAPETWSEDGVLTSGGKHYGHLDVRIARDDDGAWQARFEPVYVFPIMNTEGEVERFESRSYDDMLILESARVD